MARSQVGPDALSRITLTGQALARRSPGPGGVAFAETSLLSRQTYESGGPWSDPLPALSLSRVWAHVWGDLERSFGKLILNHPIVAVTGTVALLFLGFQSIATALGPGAETLLVLVQPSRLYFLGLGLTAYGVFLALEFHRVAKKERHEAMGVSYAFSITPALLGWAFGLAYHMSLAARIGSLATTLTLTLVVWLAVRPKVTAE